MILEEKDHIEERIIRYLSGELSEQEVRDVISWMEESESNRELFAGYKKLWINSRSLAAYDPEKVRQDRKQVDLKIRNHELNSRLDKARRYIRVLSYAASILLVLGILSTLYLYLYVGKAPETNRILLGNAIEVPYGSKSLVALPDGSKVWVNAGSRISYPDGFGTGSREVYLEGEAYFDVVKMEGMPFYVRTDMMKVKVYGTAFNIKAYADDIKIEATLDRGAISVICHDSPDKEIVIRPQQKVTIFRPAAIRDEQPVKEQRIRDEKESEKIEITGVDTETVTAWKDNRLVFDSEPLSELAKRLERQYNVNIHFESEAIRSTRYTAILKEMPIDQVLEAISLTSPILFCIKGNDIYLKDNKNFKPKK